MTLAIVAALHEELAAVQALLRDPRRVQAFGRDFWLGRVHDHEVVVVLSRVGKVAAATTASVLIERWGVSRIVFTGVAGGLAEGVRVGDVVVAQEFAQHDMDASPLFPRHEVPLYGLTRFATDAGLSLQLAGAVTAMLAEAPHTLGADTLREFNLSSPALHRGLVLSGDRFVATAAESDALRRDWADALAVEMEGAAIAQVCHDAGVPFAAVRTISDRADDAAHVDFVRFIRAVASRYCAAVIDTWLRQS